MNRRTNIRWGLLATGRIADRFATALGDPASEGTLVAVGSRTAEAARTFAAQFPGTTAHGSYEALLADPGIDAVYISTPHPAHAEWAVKAAEAGKHVLCEKPITLNHAEAMAVVEAARRHDVFLMEAFMYRCHPQTQKAVSLIREGTLGEVKMIEASFGFRAGFDANSRLFSNTLGGGGIMDVGCYPISMARLLAGAAVGKPFANPSALNAVATFNNETLVDETAAAALRFEGKIIAQIACAVRSRLPNHVRVFGSEGTLIIPEPWVIPRGRTVLLLTRPPGFCDEEIAIECDTDLYALEAATVARHILDRESPAMPPADSLGNIAALDLWRESVGLRFESEKASIPTITRRPLARHEPTKMRYGTLPGLTKPISRLVMGCDNQRTLPHASVMFDDFFERGGTTFDTAWLYGGGLMERLLGQWIQNRGVREEVVILGKGGHTPHCTPERIAAQLAQSLDRIGTDHLDIYMLHRDNPGIPAGELIDALNQHVSAGRIRTLGASNWSLDRIKAANEYASRNGLRGFVALSNNFSLAHMIEPVWPGCIAVSDFGSRERLARQQLAVFPWSSQARGFFTERGDPENADAEMIRCWHSPENFERRRRAGDLAVQKNVTPTTIALAYVLAQPFDVFALIGPRTLAETRTSFEALDVPLTPEEVRWLNLDE